MDISHRLFQVLVLGIVYIVYEANFLHTSDGNAAGRWPAESFTSPKTASVLGIDRFQESPLLNDRVQQGDLPPMEERLPEDPIVVVPYEKIGRYGGTMRVFGQDGPLVTGLSRVVRGRFLSLREEDFVIATKLVGTGKLRIIFRHMLPSLMS